jgi:hypothetical protein
MPIKEIRPAKNSSRAIRPINISRTEGEWEYIQKKVRQLGKTTLNSYIIAEIHRLKTEFEDCRECITPASGRKITKRPEVHISALNDLIEISVLMDKPISAVINELIIVPLLQREMV